MRVPGELLFRQLRLKVIYCRLSERILPLGGIKDAIFLILDLLITLGGYYDPRGRAIAVYGRVCHRTHQNFI